ncbi:hypothetical protein MRX96_012373 [Rhipicephalus microplus]
MGPLTVCMHIAKGKARHGHSSQHVHHPETPLSPEGSGYAGAREHACAYVRRESSGVAVRDDGKLALRVGGPFGLPHLVARRPGSCNEMSTRLLAHSGGLRETRS